MTSAQRRTLGVLLSIGTLLRALAVWHAFTHHAPAWFFAQSSELAVLGESLNLGHGLTSPFGGNSGPSAFLAPGYPALVALTFRLFGAYSAAAELAIMVLQTLFAVAAGLVIVRLALRLFSANTATFTAAFWAFSPTLIFFPTLFWESSFSFLLLALLLAVAMNCAAHPGALTWMFFGLLLVTVFYVNPSLLPTALAFAVWAALRNHARPRASVIATIIVCAALMSLWPLRNQRLLHAFIPLRSNLGYELWQGNRPGSDGFFDPALHPNNNLAERTRLSQLGEVNYMREKSALAHSAIAASPARFVGLSLKRFIFFWSGVEHKPTPLIIAFTLLSTIFGLAGLIRLWRRNRPLAILFTLPLVLFPLPYYITHPDFRFRAILDAVMLLLAAYALSTPARSRDASQR